MRSTSILASGLLFLGVIFGLVLALPGTSTAVIPINIGGVDVHWTAPDIPVSFQLNASGSADVTDGSDLLAVRLAFERWQDVPGSSIAFTEGAVTDRTDHAATDIHLILFDETGGSGLFPGSSVIALTPISFNGATGAIVDADIVFNGRDHSFSTDRSNNTLDIQGVAAHEIGHFIGLDHSANLDCTMFPFTPEQATSQRSLSPDDEGGAGHQYPSGPTPGSISGTVRRAADMTVVIGANVVAVNSLGVVISTTISGTDGTFVVRGLPTDTYQVYAEALDQPVEASSISSDVGAMAQTDFQTTFLGGNPMPTDVMVTAGSNTAVGDLNVDAAGAINLVGTSDVPALVPRGGAKALAFSGQGLDGTEMLSIPGTGVTIGTTIFDGTQNPPVYSLLVSATAGADLGARNLEATRGMNFSLLTGFIEVVEPAPTLASVVPTSGSQTGGEMLTINGTGFQNGAKVLMGGSEATGVMVTPTQITCTTPAGSGTVAVMVENPDGQLAVNAAVTFGFFPDPTITAIYATAGSMAGGTDVVISGSEFVSGLTVTMGGANATITGVTSTRITCTTPAGALGAADVTVTNPGSLSDTLIGAFTYLATADPEFLTMGPTSTTEAGGTEIEISGTGFEMGLQVILGRASDGTGGTAVPEVTLVDSTRLRYVTPALSAGLVDVDVVNPTGAVARRVNGLAIDALTVPGGGGGGGGCSTVAIGPATPGSALGSLLPYALLILWLAFARRRRHPETVR